MRSLALKVRLIIYTELPRVRPARIHYSYGSFPSVLASRTADGAAPSRRRLGHSRARAGVLGTQVVQPAGVAVQGPGAVLPAAPGARVAEAADDGGHGSFPSVLVLRTMFMPGA